MALTVCFLPSSQSLGAFNRSTTSTTLDLVASLLDSQLRLTLALLSPLLVSAIFSLAYTWLSGDYVTFK